MTSATCQCGECKRCRHRAYMRDWRERNRERSRELVRESYARHKHKYTTRRDPHKRKAGHLVYTEVRAGRMEPQPCEVCGDKAEAHHEDYARPLDVRWLCRLHHARLHMDEAA